MYFRLVSVFVFSFLFLGSGARAQTLTPDIRYVENGHKRHVLDIYSPQDPAAKNLPVMRVMLISKPTIPRNIWVW